MIGDSIFLFVLTNSLPQSQIWLAGLENVLFLASFVLIIIGIYFVRTSKTCRICGESVGRAETKCKYCGYVFKNNK